MHCGSSSHRLATCPRRKAVNRPPTPRGSSSSNSLRQRVNFRVSGIEAEPPSRDREGDEMTDEQIANEVDLYLQEEQRHVDPFLDEEDDDYDSHYYE